MIEVSRLEDEDAAELFLGFRIGASVVATQSLEAEEVLRQQDVRWRADGCCTQSIHRILRVARARSSLEFSWLDVSQTDVFNCSSL
jgi:hypothetical protein